MTRIYWHGVFPDPTKTGTIVRRGTLRHEVRWDGRQETNLVNVTAIQLLSKRKRCCPYCQSLPQH